MTFLLFLFALAVAGILFYRQVRISSIHNFTIRISRSSQTEDLMADLQERGGWETPAEAVEAALSFYRWALVTEDKARFFLRSGGKLDLEMVRVLRKSPEKYDGETP